MEKEKFKLLLYLERGTQDKDGKSPIVGRISAGRSMVQFSCKYSCIPRLRDSRKNRLLGKSVEAVSINKELDRFQMSIYKVYESPLGKFDVPITAERVQKLVLGSNSELQGLLHHMDEYIDRLHERAGIDRNEHRLKCLSLFHKHLVNFIRYHYRVEDIPVQKADTASIKDLEDCFAKEKGFKLNTSAGYLSMLVSLLKDLHKRYIIDTYPFINHSIRREMGTPRYITRGEVGLITALREDKLQGYEKVSRDMFLFSCLMGLSHTDVYYLTEQHVFHEAGMTWIHKPGMRTGNVCHIPLFPEVTAIIERYRGIHTRASRYEPLKGYLLPIFGCDMMNIHLREIAWLYGIQKILTCHMTRHTFASQMAPSEGAFIRSIPRVLGYSQIKTAQVYTETSPKYVFLDMEEILPQLVHYQLTN